MGSLKKAVVTGAAGFIGRPLVRRLKSIGCEVVAAEKENVADLDARTVKVDLRERGALDPFLDPDTVIFHLAARADLGASVGDPRTDFEHNLGALFEVLESARRSRCRLVFPSTGSIFDPDNPKPLSERSYVRPSSPYGAAKLAGEAYCAAYFRSYGLDTRIARLFSVYGIGMRRFVIRDLVAKMTHNPREIRIQGDGKQIRDYLYIEDTVEGLILIATKGQPGEDYNLASGQPIRILDLAQEVANLMGCPNIRILTSSSSPAGEVAAWHADISKIRQIGFAPLVLFSDGLKRTVAWLKDQICL